VLGELEKAVMEALWQSAPGTVRDVSQTLASRGLAYTTIMTTLDRLYKKGLLEREKSGHAFCYWPTMGREAYERRLVADILGGLPMASREALLSGFLDYAVTDETTLDALERLIAERKRGGD
jgi:predicted transcriptional regulator